MSNIGGAVFTEKTIVTEDDISRALRFYRDINTDIEGISKYPVRAREGFVSVSEHLKHIEARISRFSPDHLSESLRPSARTIINVMHNIWERVNENVTRSLSAGLVANKISETNLQISPGDFGFHNAIRTSDGICFLDFEYSGLDDPAKTLLDFLAQPRCALFDAARAREFAFAAFPLLIDRDLLIKRAQALAPVITLKWLTIIYSFLDEARKINKIELSSAALAEKEIVARRVIKNLNNLNSGDSHPTAAFRFENFVLR
jgi:hypothetical protein